MRQPANYSCPDCGSYLRDDPVNRGWKMCHCGYRRKSLQQLDRETPPKEKPEDPIKMKRRR